MSVTEPVPTPRRSSSTIVLAVVALLVTFLAGVLTGFAGSRFLFWKRPARVPSRAAEFLMKRLDRRLDLTPQQEIQVTRILERHHERIAAVWNGVRPQVRKEIEETNAEIERVLTPEQRAKFGQIKMRLMPRHDRPGIRFRHD